MSWVRVFQSFRDSVLDFLILCVGITLILAVGSGLSLTPIEDQDFRSVLEESISWAAEHNRTSVEFCFDTWPPVRDKFWAQYRAGLQARGFRVQEPQGGSGKLTVSWGEGS